MTNNSLTNHSSTTNSSKGSTKMYLMHEAMARAHTEARLAEARERRRVAVLVRAQRLARRTERRALQARLTLARAR
ncbi:MAG TPA: hypothetical protein VFJ14_01950 [Nocardioidaceae bacterium]|nr:hypothetical protein [Nocardioidaceae bacterium]